MNCYEIPITTTTTFGGTAQSKLPANGRVVQVRVPKDAPFLVGGSADLKITRASDGGTVLDVSNIPTAGVEYAPFIPAVTPTGGSTEYATGKGPIVAGGIPVDGLLNVSILQGAYQASGTVFVYVEGSYAGMAEQLRNSLDNPTSTLAAGITDSVATITVATGHGSRFPSSGDFRVKLTDAADDSLYELVKATARTGDVLTIERAAESASGGGAARAFNSGDLVDLVLSAGALEDFVNENVGSITDAVALAPAASARNVIQPTAGAVIAAIVKAHAAQSVDLTQWQDSAGTPFVRVGSDGTVYTTGATRLGGVPGDFNALFQDVPGRARNLLASIGSAVPLGTEKYAAVIQREFNGVGGNFDVEGAFIAAISNHSGANNQLNVIAADIEAFCLGENVHQILGSYYYAEFDGTGTADVMASIMLTANGNYGGGTVTNNYGLYIAKQADGGSSANTAIHLEDQGSAAADYALYSAGGKFVVVGSLILGRTSAPADADLANSQGAWWWDEANSLPKFKGKQSGGTVVNFVPQAFDQDLTDIAALADPNADRILFWDDSAGAYKFLTPGTNLSITGTTINASGGSVATDAIFDAKGDLAVGTGADTAAKLTVGANDRLLIADSSQASGLRWATPAEVKTALALTIGTNVQAWDADLDSLASVGLTAAGLALLDDATAKIQRTTLGFPLGKYQPFAAAGQVWSIPRDSNFNTTVSLVTQRTFLTGVFLHAGQTVNSITWISGSTALSAGVHQYFGLYDDESGSASGTARARLAVSADDTSTAWAANTAKTLNMVTPYLVPTTGLYYLAVLVEATTCPNLTIINTRGGVAAVQGLAPNPGGNFNTGTTSALANPATAINAFNGQMAAAYCTVS